MESIGIHDCRTDLGRWIPLANHFLSGNGAKKQAASELGQKKGLLKAVREYRANQSSRYCLHSRPYLERSKLMTSTNLTVGQVFRILHYTKGTPSHLHWALAIFEGFAENGESRVLVLHAHDHRTGSFLESIMSLTLQTAFGPSDREALVSIRIYFLSGAEADEANRLTKGKRKAVSKDLVVSTEKPVYLRTWRNRSL